MYFRSPNILSRISRLTKFIVAFLLMSKQDGNFEDFLAVYLTNIERESLFSEVILVNKEMYCCLVATSTIPVCRMIGMLEV